jgi:hypothetical protein
VFGEDGHKITAPARKVKETGRESRMVSKPRGTLKPRGPMWCDRSVDACSGHISLAMRQAGTEVTLSKTTSSSLLLKALWERQPASGKEKGRKPNQLVKAAMGLMGDRMELSMAAS